MLRQAPEGVDPLDGSAEIWWPHAELPTPERPLGQCHLLYLNKKGTYKTHTINAPGKAYDVRPEMTRQIAASSNTYAGYQARLAESRSTALCLVQSLGLARDIPLADRCGGKAAAAGCAWTSGVATLREQALDSGAVEVLYLSIFLTAYVLMCHVGAHCDKNDTVPELIVERFSKRFAELSESGREDVQRARHPAHGRVITPEFRLRWALRTCRDVGHMHWSQVAHMSPILSLKEQVIGDAGGGVVKYVAS